MTTQTPLVACIGLCCFAFASARAQNCLDRPAPALLGMPAGQFAATVMRQSEQVGKPSHHVAVPDGKLDSVRISLERSECYGTCPSYSIELRGDGTATYEGKSYVLVTGHHDFAVSQGDIQCLLTQFRRADFWSLADKYVADITDSPSYRITLTIGAETKSVLDYIGSAVGMPPAITALEEEVDRVGGDRWVVGNDDTLASLRNESFDFSSNAAATILANAAAKAPESLVLGLLVAGTPATGRGQGYPMMRASQAVVTAAGAGRTAIMEALIANGAFDKGAPGVKEETLRSGAASGNPLVVAAVLKQKPDVNARGRDGDTALIDMWRSQNHAPKQTVIDVAAVARLLLKAGADPNVDDDKGNTALFSASDAQVVKLLIESGAKINTRNKFGSSPLLAATTDDAAVALIEAGADITVSSKYSETIEKKAIEQHFDRTLSLLRDKQRKR